MIIRLKQSSKIEVGFLQNLYQNELEQTTLPDGFSGSSIQAEWRPTATGLERHRQLEIL